MKLENYDLDSYLMGGYHLMTANEPFFSFIITYSGHGPYSHDPEVALYGDIIGKHVKESDDPVFFQALCHAYETDVIGNLVKAGEDGLKIRC